MKSYESTVKEAWANVRGKLDADYLDPLNDRDETKASEEPPEALRITVKGRRATDEPATELAVKKYVNGDYILIRKGTGPGPEKYKNRVQYLRLKRLDASETQQTDKDVAKNTIGSTEPTKDQKIYLRCEPDIEGWTIATYDDKFGEEQNGPTNTRAYFGKGMFMFGRTAATPSSGSWHVKTKDDNITPEELKVCSASRVAAEPQSANLLDLILTLSMLGGWQHVELEPKNLDDDRRLEITAKCRILLEVCKHADEMLSPKELQSVRNSKFLEPNQTWPFAEDLEEKNEAIRQLKKASEVALKVVETKPQSAMGTQEAVPPLDLTIKKFNAILMKEDEQSMGAAEEPGAATRSKSWKVVEILKWLKQLNNPYREPEYPDQVEPGEVPQQQVDSPISPGTVETGIKHFEGAEEEKMDVADADEKAPDVADADEKAPEDDLDMPDMPDMLSDMVGGDDLQEDDPESANPEEEVEEEQMETSGTGGGAMAAREVSIPPELPEDGHHDMPDMPDFPETSDYDLSSHREQHGGEELEIDHEEPEEEH